VSRVPWQLPTQKGTEVFPETTKVPVKVVMTVPPSADRAAAQRVYERNQGVINKFYLKAAQQHALGIVDVTAMQMQVPGMKLRYSNNQGVEAVFVEVSDTVTKQEGGEEKKGWEWDFLLVDIEVPVWSTGYAEKPTERASRLFTAARMVTPGASDPEDIPQALDQQLFDSDLQQSAGDEPMLQFGGASRAEQIGTTTDEEDKQVSSLLVDIRPYHTLPVIELDIYARLDPYGIGKEMAAVLVRSVRSGVGDTRCFYIGSMLTYIATNYPALSSQITSNQAMSPPSNLDTLMPYPYDRTNVPEEVLLDNSAFSPPIATTALHSPGAEWIKNNADIFVQHLWGATNSGQWSNVGFSSPYSWAVGSWTSGADMPAWKATFDGISGSASGETLPLPFNVPGIGAVTQRGDPFWYYDGDNLPAEDWFADYGGAGELSSGAPPNVTGTPDTGSVYAEIFGWGQVYNTYVYRLTATTAPDFVQTEATVKASAFRGFGFEGTGAVWKWSKHRADSFSDLWESLGGQALQYAQWEIEDKYPDRFETGPLVPNDAVPELVITNETVPENPGSGQYLGRLTFFQEQGAFAFKPAE